VNLRIAPARRGHRLLRHPIDTVQLRLPPSPNCAATAPHKPPRRQAIHHHADQRSTIPQPRGAATHRRTAAFVPIAVHLFSHRPSSRHHHQLFSPYMGRSSQTVGVIPPSRESPATFWPSPALAHLNPKAPHLFLRQHAQPSPPHLHQHQPTAGRSGFARKSAIASAKYAHVPPEGAAALPALVLPQATNIFKSHQQDLRSTATPPATTDPPRTPLFRTSRAPTRLSSISS
jgi:hypothetical protein